MTTTQRITDDQLRRLETKLKYLLTLIYILLPFTLYFMLFQFIESVRDSFFFFGGISIMALNIVMYSVCVLIGVTRSKIYNERLIAQKSI
jgi:hypothetical protein